MRLKVLAKSRPPEIASIGDGSGWQFETRALAPGFAETEVRALASSEPTLSMFGYIGEDGAGGGVTVDRVAAALRSIGDKPFTAEINSPGGDYFAGVAIFNLMRRHSQPITVQILGVAASAASVIAMAGDRIEIAENAEIMIHQGRGLFYGTADEMKAATAVLQRIDTAMAETYAARSKVTTVEAMRMMRAETWMRGQQAVAKGFADVVMQRAATPVAYASAADQHPTDPQALDRMLAKTGMARSQRRDLFRAIKGDTTVTPTTDPTIAARNRARIEALTKGL